MSCETFRGKEISVLKLGGSLFDLPNLAARWGRLKAELPRRLLMVPGGGGFAQEVRRLDGIHHWPPETAHAFALRAMGLAAEFLVYTLPDCEIIRQLDDAEDVWHRERTPILDVRHVRELAELPATWDVTSDSIAATLAETLGAARVILAKSCDLPEPIPGLREAVKKRLIDAYFPNITNRKARLEWVNLRAESPVVQPW